MNCCSSFIRISNHLKVCDNMTTTVFLVIDFYHFCGHEHQLSGKGINYWWPYTVKTTWDLVSATAKLSSSTKNSKEQSQRLGRPVFFLNIGWVPRPSSTTVIESSGSIKTWIWLANPAKASSIGLSTISQTRWWEDLLFWSRPDIHPWTHTNSL